MRTGCDVFKRDLDTRAICEYLGLLYEGKTFWGFVRLSFIGTLTLMSDLFYIMRMCNVSKEKSVSVWELFVVRLVELETDISGSIVRETSKAHTQA